RQRIAEVVPLALLFASQAARELARSSVPSIAPETVALLERYPWPGNVRELRNVVTRAVVLCAGDRLLLEDLPPKMTVAPAAAGDPGEALQRQLKAIEKK